MYPHTTNAGETYDRTRVLDLRPGQTVELDGIRRRVDHVEVVDNDPAVHFTTGDVFHLDREADVITVTNHGIPVTALPDNREAGTLVHYWNGTALRDPGVLMPRSLVREGDVVQSSHGFQVHVTSSIGYGTDAQTVELRGRIHHGDGPEHVERYPATGLIPVVSLDDEHERALVARATVEAASAAAMAAFAALTAADPAAALRALRLVVVDTLAAWAIDEESSASSQHYIDTGRRLTVRGEDPADAVKPLQTIVRTAFSRLADADGRTAYQVWDGSLTNAVRDATYPVLGAEPDVDPEDYDLTDEEGRAEYAAAREQAVADRRFRLIDPDTNEPVGLIAVDTSTRWSYEDEDERAGAAVKFDYDERGQFDHLLYLSDATDKPVSLPEGWSEK